MDVRVRKLAAEQADLVATWQLLEAGLTRGMIKHRLGRWGWRVVHPGVYALTAAPLTQRQLWIAATLTTRDSFLSHASAAACWGFRPHKGPYEIVTRPGNGGRRRHGNVLVLRSMTLDGDTTIRDGIRITTAARTLIDMAAHISAKDTGRAFREAIRLKTTTAHQISRTLDRHPTRRGTHLLRDLATRYSTLPYHRARSNPEALALEVLHDAGIPPPRVNTWIAGEEADLAWPKHRLIIEIDGPQYHQFADEDARKQRKWERAGYVVRRLPSDAAYDDPARLLALAPRLPWST
jgi:predicted transcriptional regulator of viral defense system